MRREYKRIDKRGIRLFRTMEDAYKKLDPHSPYQLYWFDGKKWVLLDNGATPPPSLLKIEEEEIDSKDIWDSIGEP